MPGQSHEMTRGATSSGNQHGGTTQRTQAKSLQRLIRLGQRISLHTGNHRMLFNERKLRSPHKSA